MLLTLLVTPCAFASSVSISGGQLSKLTLGVEEGFVPAPMPPPSPPVVNLNALSVRLIDHQIQLLELGRASLAGPITSLAFAGTGLAVGGVMLGIGYTTAVIGVIVMAGAALPLAIGIAWLVANLNFNARTDATIKTLHNDRAALGAPLNAGLSPQLVQVATF
ncbi:MAG: hypothetical protein ACO1OB_08040 [Archangium sp.]